MRYLDVLKQSWQILWNYRLLWIFGFIIALTSFPWQSMADWNDQWEPDQGTIVRTDEDTLTFPGMDATVDVGPNGLITITPRYGEPTVIHTQGGITIHFPDGIERDLREAFEEVSEALPADITQIVIGSVAAFVLVILGAVVLAHALRYPAEAALITAVSEHSKTKKKAGFRDLLRMAFSRNAWRFFLIDVAVRLPLFVVFVVIFALALAPFLLSLNSEADGWIFGLLASAVLVLGAIILAVVVSSVLNLFTHFFRRACAIEGLGVTAAVVRGTRIIFGNLKEVIVMAVMMIASFVLWATAAVPLLIILLPVFLMFIVAGGMAAMAVLFPTALVAQLFMNDVVAWVLGGTLALVVFLPIMAAPITFLSGLLSVYQSSAWTLTYQELLALESKKAEAVAEIKPVLAEA